MKNNSRENLFILQESPEKILDLASLQKNKLENMKLHLKELLKKKLRLESEIQVLKKSIKRKQKSFQLSLKTKINLEAFGEDLEPNSVSRNLLKENFSEEEIKIFQAYDSVLEDINDLLLEIEENS